MGWAEEVGGKCVDGWFGQGPCTFMGLARKLDLLEGRAEGDDGMVVV